MNIEKDRLYTIGRLIGIYREQRRGKTQNSFTQRAFAKDICSVNTLKRLESGEVPRDEEVYIILLDKLGLKFGYYELVDNALIELMESLYEAIEYYRLDEIICLCERALSLLEKVKEYIYYNELFTLFEATYKYYKDDIIISVSMMKYFNEIYLYMDELYESLYKRMIFTRAQIYAIHELDNYYHIINELNFLCSERDSEKIPVIHYYYISKQYIKMKDLIDNLENRFLEKHNFIRLLDIYTCGLLLHSVVEKEKVLKYIKKAEQIISEKDIPNIKIREFYSNVAIAYYSIGEYKSSLNYFDKLVYEGEGEIHLPFLIYMASCQKMLDLKVSLPKISDVELKKYPVDLQIMYNYFVYDDVPLFVKQNIILKEIAPHLVDDVFIKIFRSEMKKLVELSLNYKNLYLYDNIIEENLVLS